MANRRSAPPTLRIPPQHMAALSCILQASDEQIERLESGRCKASPGTNAVRLFQDAAEAAGWPPDADALQLGIVFSNLIRLSDEFGTIDELGEAIRQAAESTGDEKLRANGDQWNLFSKRIARLARPRTPLWLTARAGWLIGESHRTLDEVSSLTDVRPVFDKNAQDGPVGLAIVHTLKLVVDGPEHTEEIYVALDSRDLKKLGEVVERAKSKQASLMNALVKTGLPLLNGDEP